MIFFRRKKCKKIVLGTVPVGVLDELGLLHHINCIVDRGKVLVKICEEEPPEWVRDICSCRDGSPYIPFSCRERGVRLGDKRWVLVQSLD